RSHISGAPDAEHEIDDRVADVVDMLSHDLTGNLRVVTQYRVHEGGVFGCPRRQALRDAGRIEEMGPPAQVPDRGGDYGIAARFSDRAVDQLVDMPMLQRRRLRGLDEEIDGREHDLGLVPADISGGACRRLDLEQFTHVEDENVV